MNNTEIVEITIAIGNRYLSKFDAIVSSCEAVGLQVSQKLTQLGLIIGRIKADKIAELQQIEGITAVEQSRSYQLPPPESDLQ